MAPPSKKTAKIDDSDDDTTQQSSSDVETDVDTDEDETTSVSSDDADNSHHYEDSDIDIANVGPADGQHDLDASNTELSDEDDNEDEEEELESSSEDLTTSNGETSDEDSAGDELELTDDESEREAKHVEDAKKIVDRLKQRIASTREEAYNNSNKEADPIVEVVCYVPKDKRITANIMSRYEYTRFISERARQIENGSRIFIDAKNMSDPIEIAREELRQRRCPLSVDRQIVNGLKERFSANELLIMN